MALLRIPRIWGIWDLGSWDPRCTLVFIEDPGILGSCIWLYMAVYWYIRYIRYIRYTAVYRILLYMGSAGRVPNDPILDPFLDPILDPFWAPFWCFRSGARGFSAYAEIGGPKRGPFWTPFWDPWLGVPYGCILLYTGILLYCCILVYTVYC